MVASVRGCHRHGNDDPHRWQSADPGPVDVVRGPGVAPAERRLGEVPWHRGRHHRVPRRCLTRGRTLRVQGRRRSGAGYRTRHIRPIMRIRSPQYGTPRARSILGRATAPWHAFGPAHLRARIPIVLIDVVTCSTYVRLQDSRLSLTYEEPQGLCSGPRRSFPLGCRPDRSNNV